MPRQLFRSFVRIHKASQLHTCEDIPKDILISNADHYPPSSIYQGNAASASLGTRDRVVI